MSIHQQELDCPKCGKITNTTLLSSINVDIDPEMQQEVIDQNVNIFTCGSCKAQCFVDMSFLYHVFSTYEMAAYIEFCDLCVKHGRGRRE